ncbi:MAG: EAL domain-containing protein [Acidobacteriota bacterium]
MGISSLERLAALLTAVFSLSICWLALDHFTRSKETVRHLVEGHAQAAMILSETDQSLSQSRQVYEYLIADRGVSIEDAVSILDSFTARLRQLPPQQDHLTEMLTDLANLRAGLLLIDEMRSFDEFSDAMTTAVDEVNLRMAAAEAAHNVLTRQAALPGETLYFLGHSLQSLKTMVTRYLRSKPDRLPVFNELMVKITGNLDRLLAMEELSGEHDALHLLQSEVVALRTNIPRLRANLRYDPNFMANTSKAEKDAVKDLWDASLRSVQAIKERHTRHLRQHSEAFLQDTEADKQTFLILSGCALALAAAGLYAIRRCAAARIAVLKKGASLISNGQLDHRIPPGPNDVIGELATEFNAMAQSLQNEKRISAQAMQELERSRDLLDERFRERNLELSEAIDSLHIKDAALAHSREGVVVCDEALRVIDANPAISRLTGYPMASLLGLTPGAFCSTSPSENFQDTLLQTLESEGRYEGEVEITTRDGKRVPLRVLFARIPSAGERLARHVGICLDITEQRDTEHRLRRQALSDALTGLPNREALISSLGSRIRKAKADSAQFAVLHLDLDDFNSINDSLGHATGDALLKIVALRLSTIMRKDGMVARLGADEFALVSGPLESDSQALAMARRAAGCFRGPFEISGETYRLSASLGLATFPRDGSDASELLKNAGLALHRAKTHGKGRLEVFTRELDMQVRSRVALERDLHQAVEDRQFEVYYQPIIEIATSRIAGAEALLRWTRNGAPVSPGEFIPLCEEMHIMREVTAILLEKVTRDMKAWEAQGVTPHVSVNISALHLSEPDFLHRLTHTLQSLDIASSRMGLEITETAIMQNPQAAAEILRQLRSRGHSLSVDDFGTGYSSLRYLQKFPFTSLKIDRQFIADLEGKESRAIVKATIAMARTLELSVVAEGVETVAQLELLTTKGCDFYQGFLFSPALPADAFAALFLKKGGGFPDRVLQPGEESAPPSDDDTLQ